MELVHSFTVPASPEKTWALLTDLHHVGSCFPGATVTEATDEEFSGTVKVKLGPIAMVYSGSGSFVTRDDTSHKAVIEARGKDKRGNGTAGASVNLSLTPDGEGTTVDVKTDLSITGKPAQFGRGVMQDVSDKLLRQFVDCVEDRLSGEADGATEADRVAMAVEETGEHTSPGVSGAPGRDVSRQDEIPPSRQRDSPTVGGDDAIDLGGALGPALMGRYGMPLAALAGVVVGYILGRGGRSRSSS